MRTHKHCDKLQENTGVVMPDSNGFQVMAVVPLQLMVFVNNGPGSFRVCQYHYNAAVLSLTSVMQNV